MKLRKCIDYLLGKSVAYSKLIAEMGENAQS
jgi:hypothetical protein